MRSDTQDRPAQLAELERANVALRGEVLQLAHETAALRADFRAKHPSAASRRAVVVAVQASLGVSERRTCKALGQHRSTQRHKAKGT